MSDRLGEGRIMLTGCRVLIIMGRLPWPIDDGWKMRSGNILKGLAAKGARIDLVAYGNPDTVVDQEFLSQVGRVEIVPRRKSYAVADLLKGVFSRTPFSILNYRDNEFAIRVRSLCSQVQYDFVLIEDVVMAQYVEFIPVKVKFLDMHNVESSLLMGYAEKENNIFKKKYAVMTADKLFEYEKKISSKFNGIFVCSDNDKNRLLTMGIRTSIEVIPNGIDPTFFSSINDSTSDNSIVFVGSMDYHANISGVLHYVENILPLILNRMPNIKTYVVGKNPPKEILDLASKSLIITGAVPDVRPYLERAAVVVVPLLVGGGTRLKILEAMAMGKAIVSTTIGCEGIDVENGKSIAVADDPESFAGSVIELLQQPKIADEMGDRGRNLVLTKYVWSNITARIADCYNAARAITRTEMS